MAGGTQLHQTTRIGDLARGALVLSALRLSQFRSNEDQADRENGQNHDGGSYLHEFWAVKGLVEAKVGKKG